MYMSTIWQRHRSKLAWSARSVEFPAAARLRGPEGKITREQVWCDLAAIQQQLGCKPV
jgi:hypothetical protein